MPHLTIVTAAPSGVLKTCLAVIALCAIGGPALLVKFGPHVVTLRHSRALPQRVVPQAELPPVEPVAFEDLSPDDARDFNASIPFVDGPKPAARPFRFAGDDDQRARALDCLATAVLYEAGDDMTGERAVAQVVLNRARHPAFPKTICGVVFQGSERSTGCQFTFTCDGALTRHRWPDDAWKRAREVADAALSGTVDKPVGLATHYHTDWVVPYWQSSLDKIAAVHTHLFFRWTGWWGTPPAFNRTVSSDEPVIAALAPLSDAHKTGAALAEALAATGEAEAATAILPGATQTDPNSFLVALDKHMTPDGYAALAARTCGARDYCKVMGWTDKTKLPTSVPLSPAQVATMSFSYLRDKAHNFDKALWNCAEFKRAEPGQCMKLQMLAPAPVLTADETKRALPVAAPVHTETFRLDVASGKLVAAPPPITPTLRKPVAVAIPLPAPTPRKPAAATPAQTLPVSKPTPDTR